MAKYAIEKYDSFKTKSKNFCIEQYGKYFSLNTQPVKQKKEECAQITFNKLARRLDKYFVTSFNTLKTV